MNSKEKRKFFVDEWADPYDKPEQDDMYRMLDDLLDQYKTDQLDELKQALEFFDKVKSAPFKDRMAAGRDHWDWLESAARNLLEKNNGY